MRIMHPYPGNALLKRLAPGTEIHGLAFLHDTRTGRVSNKSRPVLGQLCVQRYDDAREAKERATGNDVVRYFVPHTKSGALAWSRAVRVESRCYTDDPADAVVWYNELVRAAANALRARADQIEKEIIT